MWLKILCLIILNLGLSQAAEKKVQYKADLPIDQIINVKNKYEPFEPIIIGCNCDPKPGTTLKVFWEFDSGSTAKPVGTEQYVWAGVGQHEVIVTIAEQSYTEITVFVPDPAAPNDVTKAKLSKIRVAGELQINRYKQLFTVGVLPQPPPPPVPPGPTPLPPVAGPRNILILHETGNQTTEWGTLINNLSRAVGKDMPQHNLHILDVDSKDAANKRITDPWLALLPKGYTLPAIIIVDQASRKLVYADSLLLNSTSESIQALIKAH